MFQFHSKFNMGNSRVVLSFAHDHWSCIWWFWTFHELKCFPVLLWVWHGQLKGGPGGRQEDVKMTNKHFHRVKLFFFDINGIALHVWSGLTVSSCKLVRIWGTENWTGWSEASIKLIANCTMYVQTSLLFSSSYCYLNLLPIQAEVCGVPWPMDSRRTFHAGPAINQFKEKGCRNAQSKFHSPL